MSELDGSTFLVTGANAGLGRATAHDLARRGARVLAAGRSEERTLPVVESIRSETGNDAVDYVALDLADLDSVRESAAAVLARDEPIHVLVNNAGVAGQRGETKQGFELAFGINHLGHFLFTTLLLGRLRDSGAARVVNVSSDSHYQAKAIDFDAVRRPTKSVTGLPEYAVSKLANVLFTQELARRLDGTGVTTYAVHPGTVGTEIWKRVPWPLRSVIKVFMRSPEDGAKTSLWCATEPTLATETGRYYADCREKPANRVATPELAAELWSRSEEWTR